MRILMMRLIDDAVPNAFDYVLCKSLRNSQLVYTISYMPHSHKEDDKL